MPPPPPLRILAFGASLIRGHTASGTLATPSARWTREVLQKHWPGRDIEVVVEGVSGSRVTDFDGELGFGRRIQSVCKFLCFLLGMGEGGGCLVSPDLYLRRSLCSFLLFAF